MLKSAFLILIGLGFSSGSHAAKKSDFVERSQSFTVGHQTQTTYELRQYTLKGEPAYTLKKYHNGRLQAGRALTKMTYEQIQKDWNLVLPVPKKQPASACTQFIRITKTIKDGVKQEALCRESWGKAQNLRFQDFTRKMKMLSTGKQPYYERL